MKKVFIMAYGRNNLGDDIFVQMLVTRYVQVHFYINIIEPRYAIPFSNYDNLHIINEKKEKFEDIEIEEYDAFVYIGGSIFMEGGKVYNIDGGCNKFMKECKKMKKPFFYISSNFGPYKTEGYFNLAKEIYQNCTDICFRDKYSYDLFREIKSVRYAPDLVFSIELKKTKMIKNSIGITLIDLSIRGDISAKEEIYYDMLVQNIKEYNKYNMKIYLFSFCECEGDEKSIKILCEKLPEDLLKKIEIVNYRGDVSQFINQYAKMEYMICSRFHAMILSHVLEQKYFVLSYSKKIENVISDLNLCGSNNYMNVQSIINDTRIKKEDFKLADKKQIQQLKKSAEEQFKKMDEIFK